ncbi:CYTH domain-containing protein [Gloeobacter kilaueensis]|uniref:Adenylyl cyclase CyaB n=1 Tax=Gloeobacter kilaueensis (strain ATCC BAA-2537 / CCAP 1431/1 / ULC 316 / JS1) TaxID=1183438 RepID=U5QGH5_GLOK1|nr:CYTH domain-containing protein [Gloeobacter kilaueensis]AGY56734.1 adenylyl cyclase CyaB [Gloeobacter kilaueensis JS1]
MFEIEKKYRLPPEQRPLLEKRLVERYGAARRLREEDVHGFTSAQKHYLRLRTSGESTKLIAKGPTQLSSDGIRIRPEYEVPIEGAAFEAARHLVELLTIEPLPAMRRTRSVWKIAEQAEIVIDDLDALPDQPFVELEVLGTDRESAQATIRSFEGELGLDPAWQEVKSYAQILVDIPSPSQEVAANPQENVMND